MTNTTHDVLQMLCDGINPALLLSVLSEVPMSLSGAGTGNRRVAALRAVRFAVVGCVAVAVPVVLAELGKRHQIWTGHPGFPSGHTTFAAAASAAIVAGRGAWWLLIAVPATVLMMVTLVILGHHDIPEVLGGLALGVILGTIIVRLLCPRVT